jgi:hypothetical protein
MIFFEFMCNHTHKRLLLSIDLSPNFPHTPPRNAVVAELVDALDLGSSAARRESSSLSDRTKFSKKICLSFLPYARGAPAGRDTCRGGQSPLRTLWVRFSCLTREALRRGGLYQRYNKYGARSALKVSREGVQPATKSCQRAPPSRAPSSARLP